MSINPSTIAFTTESGTVIYYSQISEIRANNIIIYNGNTIEVSNRIYDKLVAGKQAYELYKLQNMKSDAELVVNEKIENLVQQYFETKFQEIADTFQTNITTITEYTTDLSSILSEARLVSSKLVKAYKTADFSTMKSNIESDLKILKESKDKLDSVVHKLKNLFEE